MRYSLPSALAALNLLAGCVDSTAPILPNAEPIFGERVTLQFYSLLNGKAAEPERTLYVWKNGRYVRQSGGMRDVATFNALPFENGDLIVQSAAAKRPSITEYAVAQKFTEGVYFVSAIDEADADQGTRLNCNKSAGVACRIDNKDQLFAFARATLAKKDRRGGLVLRLADEEPARGRKSR